jgi:UDP-N-acetylglucosamine--N-acetylmuramyl-(pentapeptide) pyrophosphoryl-undecaprenol N-acetylglucosamine transferase
MSERSEQTQPQPRERSEQTPSPASHSEQHPASASFLFAGGGTGGHIIPALAVAREMRSRGHSCFFVGTARGMEAKLVPAAGFDLATIEIGGLARVGLRQTVRTLVQLPVTTWRCGGLIRVRNVAAVFSMGGYVAGPPVAAALRQRIPVVVMEPNAVPGFTNRIIGRLVWRALVSFPETARYFPAGRTELTGLPVRDEFFGIPPKPRGEVLQILVTGGSQGSRTLNNAARQSWPLFRAAGLAVRIVHQSGANGFEPLRDEFAATGLPGEVVPFIGDMPAAYAAADLVVCRSGAGAVSELAAAGKPAVLVPFPFAADDHQTRNAEAMERAGAARLVADAAFTGERMFSVVAELVRSNGRLEKMGEAARQCGRPGAAQRAADLLEEAAAVR